jgi:hypothetical protein
MTKPKDHVPDMPAPWRGYVQTLADLGVEVAEAHLATDRDDDLDGWVLLAKRLGGAKWGVEEKARIDRAMLPVVIARMKQLQGKRKRVILVTKYITEPIAEELRREGIAFADAAGNAFLRDEGIYVLVTNRRPPELPERDRQAIHAAGLRMVFVLLQARRVPATQREIADRAGIALGGVGRILRDLEQRGWIRKTGPDRFEIQDPAAMLQRWDEGYAEILRPKLVMRRCRVRPGAELMDVARQAGKREWRDRVLLGGELAADLMTDHLRATTATLHLADEDPYEVMRGFGLLPDDQGDVMLVRHPGHFAPYRNGKVAGFDLADPLLVRAELLLHPDDRLRETAEILRREYIELRWK